MPVELVDRDVIVAVVTLADTADTLNHFAQVVSESIERHRGAPRPVVQSASYSVEPTLVLAPRQAYFAAARSVPVDEAVGRVCAELIAPYPPGIPGLAPGEQITDGALESLLRARDAGVRIAYAADPSLATVRVVR